MIRVSAFLVLLAIVPMSLHAQHLVIPAGHMPTDGSAQPLFVRVVRAPFDPLELFRWVPNENGYGMQNLSQSDDSYLLVGPDRDTNLWTLFSVSPTPDGDWNTPLDRSRVEILSDLSLDQLQVVAWANWQEGELVARVHSSELSVRQTRDAIRQRAQVRSQAETVALHRLHMAVREVPATSQQSVGALMDQMPQRHDASRQLATRSRFSPLLHEGDGSYSLTATLPLFGDQGLSGMIAPVSSFQPLPESREAVLRPMEAEHIVIDARGLDFQPVLFPSVITDRGRVYYQPHQRSGLMTTDYAHSLVEAGERSIVIAAYRQVAHEPSQLVVNDDDVLPSLISLNHETYASGNVIILIDPADAPF